MSEVSVGAGYLKHFDAPKAGDQNKHHAAESLQFRKVRLLYLRDDTNTGKFLQKFT